MLIKVQKGIHVPSYLHCIRVLFLFFCLFFCFFLGGGWGGVIRPRLHGGLKSKGALIIFPSFSSLATGKTL